MDTPFDFNDFSKQELNKLKRHNLKRLMFEKNIWASDLARVMGVSIAHVSHLRSGASSIGDRTLDKLSKALGVEKQEFFRPPEAATNQPVEHLKTTPEDARYEAEHHRIILGFIDKKWGVNTNRLLLEIEKLAPFQRDTIIQVLKSFIPQQKRDTNE